MYYKPFAKQYLKKVKKEPDLKKITMSIFPAKPALKVH